jgi:hypothetical protein
MNKPEVMPAAVAMSLTNWAHKKETTEPKVEWDAFDRCYYFVYNGMHYGVELDGHIHT